MEKGDGRDGRQRNRLHPAFHNWNDPGLDPGLLAAGICVVTVRGTLAVRTTGTLVAGRLRLRRDVARKAQGTAFRVKGHHGQHHGAEGLHCDIRVS
ncbi:MAG TPA: hypothetical protein VE422_03175 [Terriglobia bacterium]|nr:hypothetical protein [Terriglobia bacterium]